MNRLSRDQRCAVVRALVEGNSIRSTCRITGVDEIVALLEAAEAQESSEKPN
jgi:hypothetical protein